MRLIPTNDVDCFQMRLRYHNQPSIGSAARTLVAPKLNDAATSDLI